MALSLTNQDQADVIYYLGWPGLTIVPEAMDYNNTIMYRLTTLSDPMVLQVKMLLKRLKGYDEKIDGASVRLSAKQIGDIILRDDEVYLLKKERRRAQRELSKLLDISLRAPSGFMMSVIV